ncbi:MAG: MarR family winged helix-turn-helix transcriptional regulator, partial [Nitrospiria bacterium]
PLECLINETVALFYRLRVVAEQIHRQGETSGPKRGILKSLDRTGPQTVPQLARSRPASRQYIQTIVNQLVKGGYVKLGQNPAHKRSSLVHLTQRGKELLDSMSQREVEILKQLKIDIPVKELEITAISLRRMRRLFESNLWDQLIKVEEIRK